MVYTLAMQRYERIKDGTLTVQKFKNTPIRLSCRFFYVKLLILFVVWMLYGVVFYDIIGVTGGPSS